jgi:signal transduction histidine kinase
MTPRMQEILYEISVLNSPDPNLIFERIAQAVSDYYCGAMAMINLTVDGCLQFRALINPHRIIRRLSTKSVEGTFCLLTLESRGPTLIQDAALREDLVGHPAIHFKLTRYLGVPVISSEGQALGTLCFLDGRSHETLQEADIQFMSLLAMRVSAEVERERIVLARVAEHRLAVERTESLVAQLQANAEEKRRFVSMVIHDLRHPLATMQTILYLLRAEDDPSERELYLDTLENRAQALAGLLDGLNQCHQIEAGRLPLQVRTIDLSTHLHQCVKTFAPDLAGFPVQCYCELHPNLGTVLTDGDKLTHIVLNLLSNALKFTQEGHIKVRAYPAETEEWNLEVEDTGIGIPAEDQERIFEEFYRRPSANHSLRPGSGLGLAIVKRLCDTMDGRITIESEYGKGTLFRITFPREPIH